MQNNNLLKTKTMSGLFWSFADLFSSQGAQFMILLILARLLSPEYFGLIGIVTIFITIMNSIIDGGLTQALIREKFVTQKTYSTVFFFNIFMSIIMFAILFFLAPRISLFFEADQLESIIKVLASVLLINSISIIHRVILIRNIDFKTITIINLIATICSSAIAIILALKGYEVWSLVGQILTLKIVQTLLLVVKNRWLPTFSFSIFTFKRLYGFGFKLLISGLIDTIYNNVFSLIIGKMYSTVHLGFYTNASKLADVIIISITNALQRVTYPVLSSIKEDEDRLSSGFQKIVKNSAFIMFPIAMGLLAIADTLVLFLLGPNWTPSIIYFKLLCISGMLYPLHAINLNILQVKGRSDLFLKLEIIKKTLLTLLIGASLFFSLGIIGLISAAIVTSYLSFFINTYYSAKEISYSTLQQIKDISRPFILSVLMCGFVFLIGTILSYGLFVMLIIQISSGILFYVGLSFMLKVEEFKIFHQMITWLFHKVKNNKYSNLRG